MALFVLPAVAFVALLAVGLQRAAPTSVAPGARAPEFELPRLDGGTLSSEQLKGRPVVLNFWASWCVPCREEARLLEQAWRSYREEGVVFVGVNIRDALSDAERFVDEFDITYPVVRDLDLELVRKLGLTGVPETYFIDDEWTFVDSISGPQQGQQQGTVVLGPISRDALISNIEILLLRASEEGRDGG